MGVVLGSLRRSGIGPSVRSDVLLFGKDNGVN